MLDRRIGGDKFGQLGLIKGHGGCLPELEGMKRSWDMLRGNVDNVMNVSEKIGIQDVLKHKDDNSPIKVVVDGPPGVGKTTLCHKLCNMWAKNELKNCSFDRVFLLPLREERVASAENICDLVSLFHSSEDICETVSEHIKMTNGEGMLLVLDGWDEFKGNQKRSFILDIIEGKKLHKCNVLVTSRTYASTKLLKMRCVDRHVEVLGFGVKDIFSYIRNELAEDISEQLEKELKMREDVLSLCYIPFVCSMLVRVYYLCDYTLPNTLTKFYKKYLLYAIQRSMTKQELDPDTVESLDELQEDQKRAFDELCYFAYMNLKTQNTTFNRNEMLKLSDSSKCEHFGLTNCYKIADTTKYQFLHLTIQEFLAAWWISQQDDQKTLFGEHFQDTHFRMTLTFVAGLTELKDDNYQVYFSKEVDLQCVRKPLFGFQSHQCSVFHQNPQMLCKDVHDSNYYSGGNTIIIREGFPLHENYDTDTIQLLHLLFESQNTKLCKVFASTFKNSCLCCCRLCFTFFDKLCLLFFLKSSKKTWNYLHLDDFLGEDLNMFSCITLKADFYNISSNSSIKILQSLCKHLQECYIKVNLPDANSVVTVLKELFKLPHLNILHVHFRPSDHLLGERIDDELLLEMEKAISANSSIKELVIDFFDESLCSGIVINSLLDSIKGEENNNIQFLSLSIQSSYKNQIRIPFLKIENLLKNNQTLQAVKLNIPIEEALLIEVNESLTALDIRNKQCDIIICSEKPPVATNLKSIALYQLMLPFDFLFHLNPFLQILDIVLNEGGQVFEMFSILGTNTTIIAFKLTFQQVLLLDHIIGMSLQYMLSKNETLECLEIKGEFPYHSPSLRVEYLTAGLRVNSTLRELYVDFAPFENDNLKEFFDATINLKSFAYLCSEYAVCSDGVLKLLHFEELVPLVTNMLNRNKGLNFLKIAFVLKTGDTFKDDWKPLVCQFWETVLLHPALCYIYVYFSKVSIMLDILNDMKKTLITQREEKKLGPSPLVEMSDTI